MRKPAELHSIEGTRIVRKSGKPAAIPAELKNRMPFAEWHDHPEQFDKKQFVKEASDFLFDVYGIGDNQNRHTLGMLADTMEMYVNCNMQLANDKLMIWHNDGKTAAINPLVNIRAKALEQCIRLMGELGLTPKARLAGQKTEKTNNIDSLLKGPKAA